MEELIALGFGALLGGVVPAKMLLSGLLRQRGAVDDAVRLLVQSKPF